MTKVRDMFETAHEFSERFPDETDDTIWEHVEYVHKCSPFSERSDIGRAIIVAYDEGIEAAFDYIAQTSGIDFR